ncbi:hypothetical protein SLA2020_281830 [Shorea laevis]
MPKERRDRSVSRDRCPVCMEHPHNAVLLICSSHEKGCRPFMCDTSYRHSNCLDQFRKSIAEDSSTMPGQDDTQLSTTHLSPNETPESTVTEIKDWIVVEPARRFMNAKSRSCACETCNFSGTYTDLRKHARLEHPLVRPSEADPERQRSWRRLERQRDLGDLLSTLQSSFGEDRGDDNILPIDDGGDPPDFGGESYEGETGSSSRDEENDSSDGGSGPWRRRLRRRTSPDDQQ